MKKIERWEWNGLVNQQEVLENDPCAGSRNKK
jgi:hypothetical protein